MKILEKLIVFAVLIVACSTPTWAEYVIYKTTTNVVTRKTSISAPSLKEFKAAYEIIVKYKWPTSVYTFYSDPNANLQQDEETSIRQQLHRTFPAGNIEIAFIPTIIYEAAFLAPTVAPTHGLDDGQKILLEILGNPPWGRVIDQKALEVLKKVQGSDEKTQYLAILKYMFDLNKSETVISIAERVNKEICGVLKNDLNFIRTIDIKDAPIQKKMSFSRLTKIKNMIVGDDRPNWNLSAAISKYFQEFNNEHASWNKLLNKGILKDMIVKVAHLEIEAHQKNQALIFRGSKQDSPLRLKSKDAYQRLNTPKMQQRENILKEDVPEISENTTTPFSLSYGFSLMAGMAIESGGNVYNYTLGSGLGYALKIEKNLFFDKIHKSPRNLFWIPPFGTIFSFYGIDDLFHPRTMVGMTKNMKAITFNPEDYVYAQNMKTSGKVNIDQFFSYSPIVWVVGVDKDTAWDMKVSALADYISSHAITFYDPKDNIKNGQDILSQFHTDDLLFLKKHQKNFASVLGEIKTNPRVLKDHQ